MLKRILTHKFTNLSSCDDKHYNTSFMIIETLAMLSLDVSYLT